MESRIIKGQAVIQGDSIVQDQIMFIPGQEASTNTVVLLENIWDDLCSDSGTFKEGKKPGFFYWEFKETDTSEDVDIDVKLECPRPKDGLFDYPYKIESSDSKYAKYWKNKFIEGEKNYEDNISLQKKEVTFPGTKYVDQKGNLIELKETKVQNNDLGDISNLLGMF